MIEVSREVDGRVTEPLEIAVGDRLRIGATQWEKQLFNGTVVTVERVEMYPEVRRGGDTAVSDTTVSRKARNRRAGGRAGRDLEPDSSGPESEKSVHITARTDDGRQVTFRPDEIRDFHGNVRLDYGYAMTIASAQGLTVDRAFLLVDDRPARETIYPAATRHREGIDVYVNRAPLVFDIAERRPEDQADMPVTDSEVRRYLGGALVALRAQGGGARLCLGRRIAGCAGSGGRRPGSRGWHATARYGPRQRRRERQLP